MVWICTFVLLLLLKISKASTKTSRSTIHTCFRIDRLSFEILFDDPWQVIYTPCPFDALVTIVSEMIRAKRLTSSQIASALVKLSTVR